MLAEHLVVEDGLVDRNREGFLRAEMDRVRQLLRVVDPDDVEGADTDAVVGDPEADALARQLVLLEELLQGHREGFRVAQLAAYDDPVLEGLAREAVQLDRAVVRDPRGRDL